MKATASNVDSVLSVFKLLPVKDKIAVSKAIDREILIARAKKLDKSIAENSISMDDILAETKAARGERKHIRP